MECFGHTAHEAGVTTPVAMSRWMLANPMAAKNRDSLTACSDSLWHVPGADRAMEQRMTDTFQMATTWRQHPDGRYHGNFSADWYQGKGAYGGVVAGALVRSIEDHVNDGRKPLRSFTIHFAAPVSDGPASIQVQREREGSLVTHLSAKMIQDDAVVAFATATCAGRRRYADPKRMQFRAHQVWDVPSPDAVSPIEANPLMPRFTQFFSYRLCDGEIPFSGAERALLGAWLEPVFPYQLDAALTIALLDALPPAILTRSAGMRPAASVDMTTHLYADFGADAPARKGPFLIRAESRWADDGYTEEKAQLWTQDYELIAECHQLIAVLG